MDESETLVQAVRRDEDAHVAGGLLGIAPAEDDDIALLVFLDAAPDLPSVMGLVGRGPGEVVAEFLIDIAGEARAVEALGAVAAIDVGLAEVPSRFLDEGVGNLARVLLRFLGMLLRSHAQRGGAQQPGGKSQSDQFHLSYTVFRNS